MNEAKTADDCCAGSIAEYDYTAHSGLGLRARCRGGARRAERHFNRSRPPRKNRCHKETRARAGGRSSAGRQTV